MIVSQRPGTGRQIRTMWRRRAVVTSGLCMPALASAWSSHLPLRIAALPTSSSAVPLHAMMSGAFRNAGVEAQVDIVAATSSPRQLLMADGYDIVSGIHLFVAAPLGRDRNVASRFLIFHGYNDHHFFEGMVARPDAGIQGMGDLPGKTVLVASGTANLMIVREILRRATNGQEGMVSLIVAPQSSFSDLLRAGRAQAAFTMEPWGTHLQEFHGFPLVVRGLLARYMFDDPDSLAFFGGAIARDATIRHSPEQLSRLCEAWITSYRHLEGDASARQAAVQAIFPELRIAPSVGLPMVVASRDMQGSSLQQLQMALDVGKTIGQLTDHHDVTSLMTIL